MVYIVLLLNNKAEKVKSSQYKTDFFSIDKAIKIFIKSKYKYKK